MADRRRRGRWLLLAAAGAAALTVAVALGGRGGPTAGDPAGRPADLGRIAAAFSDKLPQPGPAVVTLTGADGAARWAPVLRAAAAHRLPERTSPVVATVSTRTPEGTDNLVLALVQRRTGDGNVWVKVRLPILPNGSTGWIDRDLLGAYHRVRTRLVVDRARRTATLTRDGRVVFRTRVSVESVLADTGRLVLRPRPPEPFRRPVLRAACVRHQRPLARAHRMAAAASSASTAPTGPTCSRAGSRTAASACGTPPSCGSPG